MAREKLCRWRKGPPAGNRADFWKLEKVEDWILPKTFRKKAALPTPRFHPH